MTLNLTKDFIQSMVTATIETKNGKGYMNKASLIYAKYNVKCFQKKIVSRNSKRHLHTPLSIKLIV